MAYVPARLQNLSALGLNDTQIFKYTTTDDLSVVIAPDYFSTGADATFNIGDIIVVIIVSNISNTTRTSATAHILVVTGI
jgi:hypothetical protein